MPGEVAKGFGMPKKKKLKTGKERGERKGKGEEMR